MAKRRKLPGGISGGPPEGIPWAWITTTVLGSITFGALSIHARRILDFLMVEHRGHAGRENGNLGATYRQLEAFGVTRADIRKGFAELEAAGFVKVTKQGARQAGGGEPSRYAVTWLPTLVGSPEVRPATNEWAEVIGEAHNDGVTDVRAARRWLKARVGRRPRNQGRNGLPTQDIDGDPQMRLGERLQVSGEITPENVAVALHLRIDPHII